MMFGMESPGVTMTLDGSARVKRPGEPERHPQLVVALECSRPRALSARYSLMGIHSVHFGRGAGRRAERRESEHGRELRVRIPDRWMSSSHARLEQSFGRWVLEDDDSKNGTIVNGEVVRRAVLSDGDLFELGHTMFIFFEGMTVAADAPDDIDLDQVSPDVPGLATLDPELERELGKLQQVAESPIPVLLQGESGTGKEVLARAVHILSKRSGAFVAVNCGAIPANLVESELFGHKKGAFSGAVEDRPGLIRSADRGTSFLDEIGDLPASSQAALLRVLQEREVMPVGAARPVSVDLRVVCATHRNLDAMVETGDFRRDLFARLNGFRMRLPPLRERRSDLGLLISVLLARIVGSEHPGLECDAARALFGYSWPLNIRELEQALQTASVLAGDDPIELGHLPDTVRTPRAVTPEPIPAPSKRPRLSADDEKRRQELIVHLREHRGNISAIARTMGKDRKQIQRWLKRYQLNAADYKD
jgi:DNA-binding NtrC family response regulator